jgi:hypothetical protein
VASGEGVLARGGAGRLDPPHPARSAAAVSIAARRAPARGALK